MSAPYRIAAQGIHIGLERVPAKGKIEADLTIVTGFGRDHIYVLRNSQSVTGCKARIRWIGQYKG